MRKAKASEGGQGIQLLPIEANKMPEEDKKGNRMPKMKTEDPNPKSKIAFV